MKTQRILGVLWVAICGLCGILLLSNLPSISRVVPSGRFYVATLLGLLYLAGAVAGFVLFSGARWARGLAGVVAVLILIATIAQIAVFGLPGMCGVVGVFAMISAALMFFPRHDTAA